jgi:hypothetical protein
MDGYVVNKDEHLQSHVGVVHHPDGTLPNACHKQLKRYKIYHHTHLEVWWYVDDIGDIYYTYIVEIF